MNKIMTLIVVGLTIFMNLNAKTDLSTKKEIQHSVNIGLKWLEQQETQA